MSNLKPETREKLKKVATPTLMTALYKRGLRNQFIQDVHRINVNNRETMVGEAFTLRYMPAREDLNPITIFRERTHPQRVAVEQCPPGAVMVMDSRKDPRAASAGSILITRLVVRGCAGVVTDGGFRDTYEISQLDMPCYHSRPSAPTNLTLHQAIDINVPIGCGDAPVFPGRRHRRGCRRLRRHSCASCGRTRGRVHRDDRLRGLRHRASRGRQPFDHRALSGDRRKRPRGIREMAEAKGTVSGSVRND